MKTRYPVFALLAVVLSGCASNGVQPTLEQKLASRGYALGQEAKSIKSYTVNGWNYIDDRHVIIDTGPGSKHLLTLYSYCPGLSSAEHLGLTSKTAGDIDRFESVTVTVSSSSHYHCPIKMLNELARTPKPGG